MTVIEALTQKLCDLREQGIQTISKVQIHMVLQELKIDPNIEFDSDGYVSVDYMNSEVREACEMYEMGD